MLFVDSADKAARFIWMCDAFEIPLCFLADVPGFMIGSKVEKQGIIRHGAKMIAADERGHRAAHLRRGAQGLRRRPLRDERPRVRARRHARAAAGVIAVMGPEAAVNAVYFNKIQAIAARPTAARGRCATSGGTSTSRTWRASS